MSILHVTKENFEKEVLSEKKKVIVDYWASWCMPCRMLSPIIEEIADENADVKVCKVNVEEEEELAFECGIKSIPTVIVYEDGKPVNKSIGYQGKEELVHSLEIK